MKHFILLITFLLMALVLSSCAMPINPTPGPYQTESDDQSTVTHEPDPTLLPWNSKMYKDVLYTIDKIVYRVDDEHSRNYLILIFVVENHSDNDVTIGGCDVYCDSYKASTGVIFDEEYTKFDFITLLSVAAHKNARGYAVFEIPAEYTDIEVQLTGSFLDADSLLVWDIINGK